MGPHAPELGCAAAVWHQLWLCRVAAVILLCEWPAAVWGRGVSERLRPAPRRVCAWAYSTA